MERTDDYQQHNCKSNEMVEEVEQTKIRLLRASVERQDPSSKVPYFFFSSCYIYYIRESDISFIRFWNLTLARKCAQFDEIMVFRLNLGVQEVDDLTLRRFLRARDLDIQKASLMFLKYLKWRQEFVPNSSISPSEVPNEIAQNKMFLQGTDKKGRPITVVLGRRHFQNKESLDEFKLDMHLAVA
ncbi:hypothetical protein GH714_025352 [Hevea brasiliensis]|uniref:CRAL/TRIO N-terminal domain-containing protein n=1 Tax=Hevea brasiliensis TaxID=3981 RepID=A0A6A6MGV2_HEVBR|nr:hypothetical protein GH714_025352 [Hevea brasiliensis]